MLSPLHSQEVANLLLSFKQMLHEQVKRYKSGYGLSPMQVQALFFIRETSDPRMRDLATYLAITPPSATALITSLIRSGYVRRSQDRQDRRTLHIMLTPKGKRALEKRLAIAAKGIEVMLHHLTLEETRQFTHLLKKIVITQLQS